MRLRCVAADGYDLYLLAADAAGTLFFYDGESDVVLPLIQGWTDVEHVVCNGDGILYTVRSDGSLYFHRRTVTGITDGVCIHPTFGTFHRVMCGGNGVLYAVDSSDQLRWFRDLALDGSNLTNMVQPRWQSAVIDEGGWLGFRDVFAGRGGQLFAVDQNGQLLAYNHPGFLDGTRMTAEPGSVINWGWHQATCLVNGGKGIYAFKVGNFSTVSRYPSPPAGSGEPIPQLDGWQLAPVEGYCWPLSVGPGTSVKVYVSACQTQHAQIDTVRLEQSLPDGRVMARSLVEHGTVELKFQPSQRMASETGFNWHEIMTVHIPGDWKPGFYAVRVRSPGGFICHIPFVVSSDAEVRKRADNPPVSGTEVPRAGFLVLANTNTWNAYNDWGGPSNYTGNHADPRMLSFRRPNPRLLDVWRDSPLNEGNHTLRAECNFFEWLTASTGDDFHLVTDSEFHFAALNHAAAVDTYCAIILHTHPEYWSAQMRELLTSFCANGGSLIYLGGNGIYRRVAYLESGSVMCTGNADRYLFRKQSPPAREADLLGVEYQGAPNARPYDVRIPAHWVFENTEYAQGVGVIPVSGTNQGPAGIEVDGEPIPPAAGAAGFVTLAKDAGGVAAMRCRDSDTSFTFSAGSIAFGSSVIVDHNLQRLVRNLLQRAGRVAV